jgi:hypothetical protein
MSKKIKKNKSIIQNLNTLEIQDDNNLKDIDLAQLSSARALKKSCKVIPIVEDTIDIIDVINIKDFKSKELIYYRMLDKYFNDNATDTEIQTMIDIINGNHLISLRFLDWFVTRYCYLYKLSINVNNTCNKEKNFNINISYKAQLKSFKKKYFDPFRRKKKFYYQCGNNNLLLLTTIGQLNFFRWAITNDIIKYTSENYKEIIDKYVHVNTYFKKNLIDNSSFSTSDENIDLSKSDGDIEINSSNKKIEIISKHKCPVISRNIFLEF